MYLFKHDFRSFVLLALTLLSGATAAVAQITAEQHKQIRAALDRDDPAHTSKLLEEAARSAPAAFKSNNYDYLLARVKARQSHVIEARRLFEQVVARGSVLSGYALWHLAEIARRGGVLADEQKLLEQLLSNHPNFLHRKAVVQRLATSYSRSRKYSAAISMLLPIASTRGSIGRENLAQVANAQLAAGQTTIARATFESLLAGGSMDDGALRAASGLDRIDQAVNAAISEAERLRRARIYQINRDFAAARKHWLVLAQPDAQPASRREALFQLGRGHYQELNFAEAMRWYQQVHDEFPTTEEGEQGYYFVGHCHQALYKPEQAIARYEQFIRDYPTSDYFGYAYLNAIDTLRIAEKLEDAAKWATRAQTEVQNPFIVTRALFDRAKIRMTQGIYTAALADLTSLLSRNLALRGMVATTNPSEVGFLRALCFEQLGRFDDAIGAYLGMVEGRNDAQGYYGFQASNRLRALAKNLRAKNIVASRFDAFVANARAARGSGDAAAAKLSATQALRLAESPEVRSEMLSIIRDSYAKLPAYRLPVLSLQPVGRQTVRGADVAPGSVADELMFLGLYDEGASELVAERPGDRGPAGRNWLYTLAVYCGRGDCPSRTLKFADPILSTLPADYRVELLPKDLAEMFYPMAFREAFARHATPREVDPRFVLSIARQESRYDPEVKSFAAARGLLQFISSTSEQIATQLEVKDFDQNDLYLADTAILIGSQYLKNLLDEFKTPQAAAAAYNGSEDSVRRWLSRSQSTDVDRFVIEIAKRETKDYVFKVMNNYRAYQAVYPRMKGNGQSATTAPHGTR